MISFGILVGIVAALAGAVASVTGFGIGSLLTPVLASQVELKIAVAAVSIPHAIGTALRFWRIRHDVDRSLLWSFGITSAGGGLVGALLHDAAKSPALTAIFAFLLTFAGIAELTGWAKRMRFRGVAAWIAGGLSGLFGGLVGNQGGLRSAAMLGLGELPRNAFIATATATALFVDAARMPVYLITQLHQLAALWDWIGIAAAGVVIGTLGGEKALRLIPEPVFRKLVASIVLLLGLYEFYVAAAG